MTTIAEVLSSVKSSVEDTRNRHVAAVNAGNADVATNLFAPEAIMLPPGQPPLKGTRERSLARAGRPPF
jgi:hypothetical protein